MAKLVQEGVRGGGPLELLQSYLGGRSLYVYNGGHELARDTVKCIVPQGSVLGLLFFLIYVNDMT